MDDDEASTALVDASGNALHATLVGADSSALSTAGKIDKAINFGGSYNANLPNEWATLLNGESGCSFGCWFKLSSTAPGCFIYLTTSGNYGKFLVDYGIIYSNKIRVGGRSYSGDSFQSVTTVNTLTDTTSWHHLVAVIDVAGNAVLLYLDGVLQSVSGTVSFGQSTFSADVGNTGKLASDYAGNSKFPGPLDDVRLDGGVWTPGQIKRIFNENHGTGDTLEELYAVNEENGLLLPLVK